VSLPGNEDLTSHLLSAKDRDLGPLVRESEESLDLDQAQAVGLEAFLDRAWFSGTHACHAQMLTQAREHSPDFGRLDVRLLEADFKALMDESADALNLTITETVNMWNFLGRACVAGIRSCRAELTAMLFEATSDIGEEALRWLEGRDATAS
jgi:hypothetical protein